MSTLSPAGGPGRPPFAPAPPPAAAPPDSAAASVGASARSRAQAFRADPVELPQVTRLLQGAFDAARPGCWGRAVLPPLAWHELAVYVLLPEAVHRYHAPRRQLALVRPEDLRAASGSASIAAAPLTLVYVADFDEVQQAHAEEHGVCAGANAGCIAETVRAHGVRAGLGSVIDGRVDRRVLARVLGLKPTERILLAQCLGYPAREAAQ